MTLRAPGLCQSCSASWGRWAAETKTPGPAAPRGKETQTRLSGGLCTARGGNHCWRPKELGATLPYKWQEPAGSTCPLSETPDGSRPFLLQSSGQQSSCFPKSNNSITMPELPEPVSLGKKQGQRRKGAIRNERDCPTLGTAGL